jgi:hypothetical protein
MAAVQPGDLAPGPDVTNKQTNKQRFVYSMGLQPAADQVVLCGLWPCL